MFNDWIRRFLLKRVIEKVVNHTWKNVQFVQEETSFFQLLSGTEVLEGCDPQAQIQVVLYLDPNDKEKLSFLTTKGFGPIENTKHMYTVELPREEPDRVLDLIIYLIDKVGNGKKIGYNVYDV